MQSRTMASKGPHSGRNPDAIRFLLGHYSDGLNEKREAVCAASPCQVLLIPGFLCSRRAHRCIVYLEYAKVVGGRQTHARLYGLIHPLDELELHVVLDALGYF